MRGKQRGCSQLIVPRVQRRITRCEFKCADREALGRALCQLSWQWCVRGSRALHEGSNTKRTEPGATHARRPVGSRDGTRGGGEMGLGVNATWSTLLVKNRGEQTRHTNNALSLSILSRAGTHACIIMHVHSCSTRMHGSATAPPHPRARSRSCWGWGETKM
jgi:hypothetical protein